MFTRSTEALMRGPKQSFPWTRKSEEIIMRKSVELFRLRIAQV
jgi:hypothetical protein